MRQFLIVNDQEINKYPIIKKENIIIPQRQTSFSCGYDFYVPYDILIKPEEKIKIFTGIKVIVEDDEFLMLCIRSSMAIKNGLILTNQVGIIDSDYANNSSNDGHIIIAITNTTKDSINIKKGDRICQGIIMKYLTVENDDNDKLRNGGFGSTNKG